MRPLRLLAQLDEATEAQGAGTGSMTTTATAVAERARLMDTVAVKQLVELTKAGHLTRQWKDIAEKVCVCVGGGGWGMVACAWSGRRGGGGVRCWWGPKDRMGGGWPALKISRC